MDIYIFDDQLQSNLSYVSKGTVKYDHIRQVVA
jgi:hypothetical protein